MLVIFLIKSTYFDISIRLSVVIIVFDPSYVKI